MDSEKLDINAVCFGILCTFTPVCGEERAKEAAELVRKLHAENEKLRDEMEQVKRERDAVIEQLHGMCNVCKHYYPYHNRGKCAFCEHETIRDTKIPPVDNWEWRGS